MMRETTINTDSATAPRHRTEPTRAQLLARERFEHNIARLHTETALGSPRANLDVLVRLCQGLLDDAGHGPIVTRYRVELGRARAVVSWRGETRVVR